MTSLLILWRERKTLLIVFLICGDRACKKVRERGRQNFDTCKRLRVNTRTHTQHTFVTTFRKNLRRRWVYLCIYLILDLAVGPCQHAVSPWVRRYSQQLYLYTCLIQATQYTYTQQLYLYTYLIPNLAVGPCRGITLSTSFISCLGTSHSDS